ncbi:response regulator transcription factor [Iamia sp. SCSIO 61187]|uniref:response regulator transcription factor n=1 Tax=Iamia sp. SCSIO 61187 TaxID=2722752 RepID=UPI001C62CBFC|nr:response regulator transcription factor [Iamia sp. SCSIO 61187]QYG92240.1 response regulator transcription factor [Iamia sp. SCSIO 61187]
MSLSLLVVDDHEGVANALAELMNAAGCDPVFLADSSSTAVNVARRERIDVATIDLDLGGEDGLDLLALLIDEHPHLPLLILSATSTPDVVVTALRAGAAGYVPKTASSEDLLAAVRAAAEGHMWLPVELIGPVVELMKEPAPPSDWEILVDTLSERERQVLGLMVDGLSRSEIGTALSISLNTVRTHVKSILAKLGVHASLEAVSLALRAGIRPEGPGRGRGGVRPGAGPPRSAGPPRAGSPGAPGARSAPR